MKKVLILGSSGSIGVNALNVIKNFPDRFEAAALTVNSRIDILEKQVEEFNPPLVVVKDDEAAKKLRKKISIRGIS